MKRLALGAMMACAFPAATLAGPPDLETVELGRGEVEVSIAAYAPQGGRGPDRPFQTRQELGFGVSDRFNLELQFDQADDGEEMETSIAFQATGALLAWEDGAFGVSAEIGRELEARETEAEVLGFAAWEAGPYEAAVNLGVEWPLSAPSQAGFVYAGQADRRLGRHWTAGLWGGGASGDDQAEHALGPRLAFTPGVLELSAGLLLDTTGEGHDLLALGLAATF